MRVNERIHGNPAKRVVRSTCRLCYNNCGVLVHTLDQRPVKIEGDPSHPVSKGALCKIGMASLEYLESPYRLRCPLKRVGPRGQGAWEAISWDEALDTVAHHLKAAKQRYGAESIQMIRGGHKSGIIDGYLSRFANVLGTPNISSMASVCWQPGVRGSELTYGYLGAPDYEYPPRCIVVWGCDPASTLLSAYHDILRAIRRREGETRLLVIDPVKTPLSEQADLWIRLRPGTDLAFALGLIHVMIRENWVDEGFIDLWAIGFPELRKHVEHYPPERVSEITWVPPEQIVQAAKLYALNKPACIQWGNGIETNVNSLQTHRAVAILRTIAGNLGIPGGELKWTGSGILSPGSAEFTCQNELPERVRNKRLSANDGLAPFVFYVTPQRMIEAMLRKDPYPLRVAYVLGGNIINSYAHSSETYQALMGLDFLVVADLFMTPTAFMADIVLPVASYLEFDSLAEACHVPVASIQQKVATVGESWSDLKILNELAKRLRLPHFWEDVKDSLDDLLKPVGITFDEFRTIGVISGRREYRQYEREGFATPSKKVELFSQRLEQWGFDPLPRYHELPETPYSEPKVGDEFPFVLVSKKRDCYRHSGGRQIPFLRALRPEPIVEIHRQSAERLGIQEGDFVFIETRRGRIRQKAHLVEELDPRTVVVDYGWYFPEKENEELGWRESNINILTTNQPPFNREMGTTTLRGFFCKLYKA